MSGAGRRTARAVALTATGLALSLALSLALTACGGSAPPDPGTASERDLTAPRSGGTLPDVTLAPFDEGGRSLDLGELRGPAVVNLWASWCGPCERELPFYQQVSERYAGELRVIGVDFQETRQDAARRLLRDTGVTYDNYLDPDGELRAAALPKLLLVDEDGRVALEQYLEIDSAAQLESLVREHLGVTRSSGR